MAEYIERDAAIKRICEILAPVDGDDDGFLIDLFNKGLPAADVVPVVRCKDCRYNGSCMTQIFVRDGGVIPFDPNTWYCADGARMDGDGDV